MHVTQYDVSTTKQQDLFDVWKPVFPRNIYIRHPMSMYNQKFNVGGKYTILQLEEVLEVNVLK